MLITAKLGNHFGVFLIHLLDDRKTQLRELKRLIKFLVRQESVFMGERSAHTTWNRRQGMNRSTTDTIDDILTNLPKPYGLLGKFGIGGNESDDVTFGRIRIWTQDEIRRR